jgi:predicted nucleic acid-binding protein
LPRPFFDSNTLLYMSSDNATKAAQVEALVNGGGVVSVQVLNEVANVARKKMRMEWNEVLGLVASVREWFEIVPLTETIHEVGLYQARRHMLSVYDGMIVAAALEANCTVLYSEDMHDGLVVDGRLTIRNPFRAA